MKTEEALALLLARLSFDKLTKTRIFHLIKNHVDWYEILNICVKKKLICLVYKKLEDLNLIQFVNSSKRGHMLHTNGALSPF